MTRSDHGCSSVVILVVMEGPGRGQSYAFRRPLQCCGEPYNRFGVIGHRIWTNFIQPGTRGLVLHVEPLTCGQEDAIEHGLPMWCSCRIVFYKKAFFFCHVIIKKKSLFWMFSPFCFLKKMPPKEIPPSKKIMISARPMASVYLEYSEGSSNKFYRLVSD